MDIILQVLVLLGIGFLFYVYLCKDKKERSIAPVLIIILVSVLMLGATWKDSTYITTGFNETINYDDAGDITGTSTVPIKIDFGFDWALYLAYTFFFVIGSLLALMGDKYK